MRHFGLPEVETILCLGAHSDDIEIGCGGTILRLLREQPGLNVHWIVVGASGRRQQEAVSSARRFLEGAADTEIKVMGFRDSYFPYIGGEIKDAIHELSAQISPDIVFTHFRDDRHQDHRLLSDLAWNAFRDHIILEYEIPKYDGDMSRPNFYVPLDQETCQQKIETLLACFPTQHDKNWFTEDTFWALLRLRGVECHAPSKFAEAFHARKVVA